MDNNLPPDTPNPYAYSGSQWKMIRLYELLRESLRFEKYYAYKLKRWRRGNIIADSLIALSAAGSFSSAEFMQNAIGKGVLTGTLVFSTVATILKPVIKPSNRISRLTKLQAQYLELYQDLHTLMCQIREIGEIQAKHERQLELLHERFNKLGVQNEPDEDQELMRRFQDEVETEIPSMGLWLPENATEEPDTTNTTTTAITGDRRGGSTSWETVEASASTASEEEMRKTI